jgi:DNA-binding IclR family transcriptional regulator
VAARGLGRGLRALEHVMGAAAPITASALAADLGLDLPATEQLVDALAREGYLARVEGGVVAGPRGAELLARPPRPPLEVR